MNHFAYFFVAVLVVLLVTGGAAAQSVEENQSNETSSVTFIHPEFGYSDVEASPEEMRFTLHNLRDRPRTVTIIDSGGVFSERDVPRQSVRVTPGEREVRVSVTEIGGMVGVTIDTGDTLHGVPREVESSGTLIGGPWGPSDSQASALGAALGVSVACMFVVIRRIRGTDQEVERIA